MGKGKNIEKSKSKKGSELESAGDREPGKSRVIFRLRKQRNSEDYEKNKEQKLCLTLPFDQSQNNLGKSKKIINAKYTRHVKFFFFFTISALCI